MGYGGGGTDMIMTLPESAFSLTYKGKDYFGITPSEYLENIGTPYSETILGRKENYESVLIFEIPKGDFTPEDTYITVDFGSYGKKVWNFV